MIKGELHITLTSFIQFLKHDWLHMKSKHNQLVAHERHIQPIGCTCRRTYNYLVTLITTVQDTKQQPPSLSMLVGLTLPATISFSVGHT